MSEKIRVVVLYGGKSTEHDISCRSASFVLKNLDKNKYQIQAIAIDKTGNWIEQDTSSLIKNLGSVVSTQDFRSKNKTIKLSKDPNPTDFLRDFNEKEDSLKRTVFFPVLHGTNGEDGAIQGLFSLGNVAFVGSGILGSSMAIDKCIAKKIVSLAGVPVVPWVEIRKTAYDQDPILFMNSAIKKLGFPIFVKPACLGSSVGISKAENLEELTEACELALSFGTKIMLEKAMNIREIECAALGGYNPEISEPGEVIPHSGFYTYEAKYLNSDQATIRVPADIDENQAIEAKKLSKKIFQELECYGLARIDLFLEKETGNYYFNEANTLPGFTEISQFPILWKHAGLSARELLDRLIELALQRQNLENDLETNFSK